jgi:hypothetical protein
VSVTNKQCRQERDAAPVVAATAETTNHKEAAMSLEVPTQESAQRTLERILRIAVSGRLPDEHRLELGRAVAWLQRLIDCDVLARRPPPSPAVPGSASIERAGASGAWGQGEPGAGRLS